MYKRIYILSIAFFILFSSYGQTLDWVRVGGGNAGDDYGYMVKKTEKGNIYTAGQFKESATFGNKTIFAAGGEDMFVSKYDSLGNLLWVKGIGTNGRDEIRQIEIDKNENIFIYQTLDTVYYQHDGGLLYKYDSDGVFQWKLTLKPTLGPTIPPTYSVDDFVTDSYGNIYVSGTWSKAISLGNLTIDDSNFNRSTKGFLFKVSPTGNVDWGKRISGSFLYEVNSTRIRCVNDTIIYIQCYGFFDEVDIGDGIKSKFSSQTGWLTVYARYNQSGKAAWVSKCSDSQITDFLPFSPNEFYTITKGSEVTFSKLDSLGNIYFKKRLEPDSAFLFSGEMKAGSDGIYFGGQEGVSKYDKEGNLLWVQKVNLSSSGLLSVKSADWDLSGNLVLSGGYFNNVALGGDTLKSKGFQDILTIKVGCKPVVLGNISGDTLLCSGRFNYSVPFVKGQTYHWSVSGGGIVSSSGNTSIIDWTQEGIYTITVTPENQCGLGSPQHLKVRVRVKPSKPVLSGDTIACLGSSAYSVVKYPEVSYAWSVSGGGAMVPIANTAVVNWTSTGVYTITVIPSNICGTGTTLASAIIVDKIPSQPLSINGSNDICLGKQLYSVPSEVRTSYNWGLSSGGSMNVLNNLNNVTWTTAGIHSITVSPYNHCGIGQAQLLTVNVKDVPSQPSAISGNASICKGVQEYSIVETPGVTYTWTLSGGGAIAALKNVASVNFVQAGTYTMSVIPQNSCGFGAARTKTIQVIDVPVQPDSILGIKNVCLGKQTYMVPSVQNINYSWSVSGGGTFVPNSNSAQINWTTPGTYTVTVVPYNTCGYGNSTSLIVVVKNLSSQISSITGKDKACLAPEVYNVPFITGFTYNWSLSSGGTLTTANNSTNVTWSSPGLHTLSVTTSDGCTVALPVYVNDIPKQPSLISGDSSVCLGSASYSITAINETSYTWHISGGGSIASLVNTASVDWMSKGAYIVSVIPSNYCGEGQVRTLNVKVNDKPAMPVSITGPEIVCLDSIIYNAPVNPEVNYTWSLNDGGLLAPLGDSAKVYWGKPGQYMLSLVASNQCGTSPSISGNITVMDKPLKSSIVGDTSSCLEVKSYKVMNSKSDITYLWTLSSGGDLFTFNDSSSISWTSPGNYLIEVLPVNRCGSGVSTSLAIKVKDVPPVISDIIGDTITCKTLKTYLVPNVQGTNYSWNLSGGGYINPQGNSSVINWTTSGTYLLSVYPKNQCGNGNATSKNIYVREAPSVPGFIKGPIDACIGSSSYLVDSLPGITYNWTLTGTGKIEPTTNSNKVNVDWTNKGLYGLNVTPNNSCGTGPSRTLNIRVEDVPENNSIVGLVILCLGTANEYSVTPMNGVNYSWSYTGLNNIISNGARATLIPLVSGVFFLNASLTNHCGTSDTEKIRITVKDKPVLNDVIQGDSIVCTKSNSIYSVLSDNQNSFHWALKPNGGSLNNLNEKALIDWAIPGDYKLTLFLNNECGNSDTAEIDVTTIELPMKPFIKQTGDTLVSSVKGTSQWYFNGTLLPEDTIEVLRISRPGEYYVRAVNYCGEGPVSDKYYFTDRSNYYGFPVIPNPASTMVTVKIPKYLKWKYIELIDGLGQTLMEIKNNDTNEAIFNIDGLIPGIYIFRIETELGVYKEKLIKL